MYLSSQQSKVHHNPADWVNTRPASIFQQTSVQNIKIIIKLLLMFVCSLFNDFCKVNKKTQN